MSYVIYALFKAPGAAERALSELATAQLPKNTYQVFIHKKLFHQDLRTSETDWMRGLTIGLLVGAITGALLGGLLCGPMGFLQLPVVSAMGVGIFLGMICGVLGGGIYSTGLIHRNLRQLVNAFQPGHTLLTAELETEETRSTVNEIFNKHGAIKASRGRRLLTKILPIASRSFGASSDGSQKPPVAPALVS
jgi:hypothetical protein